ncbi:MAG TPA: hypothetical protein VGK76_01875 [Candidatus Eisenbacteria bacterium]
MNGGAAAAAAALVRAIKASGAIVRVEAGEFVKLLNHNPEAVVVHARGGFFVRGHRYLTSYKGLAFYARSREPLLLPGTCEVVEAGKIWVPRG